MTVQMRTLGFLLHKSIHSLKLRCLLLYAHLRTHTGKASAMLSLAAV